MSMIPFSVHRPPGTGPMGAHTPTVTVVVPCYNYGRFLESCVQSIVNQHGVKVDVHIIDDASTDGSDRVAEQLGAQYANVSVTKHQTNQGHIATYNEGLPAVRSDYVALLSADDLLAPGALDRATRVMESDRTIGMVYGHPAEFATSPAPTDRRWTSYSKWGGDQWIRAQMRRGLSIVQSPECLVRNSVHRAVGYYRPELPHSGDLEMWMRVAAVSNVARLNGPDQAYRRVHPQSMMRSEFGTLPRDLEERAAAYESFLNRSSRNDAASLREIYKLTLSREALRHACSLLSDVNSDTSEVESMLHFALELGCDLSSVPESKELHLLTDASSSRIARRLRSEMRMQGDRFRWRRWRHAGC